MKNKIIILLLTVVLPGMAYASSCKIDMNNIIASTYDIADSGETSKLLIKQDENENNYILRLDSNCKETILNKSDDNPISIFYFSDCREIFGTLWTSGVALIFRVYSNKTGKMIFEEYSKTPPSVFWVDDIKYPIFYVYNCNSCDNSRSGFYVMGKNKLYKKATSKEYNMIKEKIAKQLVNSNN